MSKIAFQSIIVSLALIIIANPILYGDESPKIDPRDRMSVISGKSAAFETPNVEVGVHDVGDVWLTVSNHGQFGINGDLGASTDPVTGVETPSCEYPANSNNVYLYVAGFWIGAVVGRDTLVSVGVDDYYEVYEFWPGADANDGLTRRSILTGNDDDAKSEQDIIAVYSDTLTDPAQVNSDRHDSRPHIPLNIEITQRSYAWSYSYAKDFILFDYSIHNIGRKELTEVYMGIYVDGDVHNESINGLEAYNEDLCGFKKTYPTYFNDCVFDDEINMAYIIDNNGDPNDVNQFTNNSALGAAGVRVVRTPSDSLKYSFNWWVTDYSNSARDFGPRRSGTEDDPFRVMNVLGTPLGDANKYYLMKHEEFDYDQLYSAVDHSQDGWLPRSDYANDICDGFDARFLLSFGPFNISPGEILPVSFAWVLADSIHTGATNFENYFNPANPDIFYNTLDFSPMARNSTWASKIYDNPGYDTNGDKNRGKFRECCLDSQLTYDTTYVEDTVVVDIYYNYSQCDTIYYEGDGIPDFRGASPPPAPKLWAIDENGDTLKSKIEPKIVNGHEGQFLVRWNGYESENTPDNFSQMIDFEGYNVYISNSLSANSYTLIASYDRQNYNRWIYNSQKDSWELIETPFTIDELNALYENEPAYTNPDLINSVENATTLNGQAVYFTPQFNNQYNLLDSANIYKAYPDAIKPPDTLSIDSARIYAPELLTEDQLFFKYYEYECLLDNLLPSQLYYISVTAFDFGSPVSGLAPLETPVNQNIVAEYPQYHAQEVVDRELNVVVYPNPYRIDGNYIEEGYEGKNYIDNQGNLIRQENIIRDRTRAIHFINLPEKCTIRIFTIDGDLVREVEHDVPADNPQSGHEVWDLISRNTQAIVSGIYYYTVESDYGNQMGKLVIIM